MGSDGGLIFGCIIVSILESDEIKLVIKNGYILV